MWPQRSLSPGGMVASTLVERYLLCSTVLRSWSCLASDCWQIFLDALHHGCDLNDRICTKHCVLPGKRRFRCGEKLARARDGLRRRRFAVDSCSFCVCSGTEGSRWLFLFFVDAVLLCFACIEMLCALELLHPSDEFHSSVLHFFCVLLLSVCRSQWNGCANAGRKVPSFQYCLAILIVSCKWLLADLFGRRAASWMPFEW